jgi:hypothetical protein
MVSAQFATLSSLRSNYIANFACFSFQRIEGYVSNKEQTNFANIMDCAENNKVTK